MTAEEIVGAVADAIWNEGSCAGRKLPWIKEEAQRACLAMLDAIREPTHEMIASVSDYAAGPRPELHDYAWELEREGIFNTWTAMIDALKAEILGPPGKDGGL